MPLAIVEPVDVANGLIQDRFISHVHLGQRCITEETVDEISAVPSLAKLAFKLPVRITEQVLLSNLLVQKFDKVFNVVDPHVTLVDLVEEAIALMHHLLQLNLSLVGVLGILFVLLNDLFKMFAFLGLCFGVQGGLFKLKVGDEFLVFVLLLLHIFAISVSLDRLHFEKIGLLVTPQIHEGRVGATLGHLSYC